MNREVMTLHPQLSGSLTRNLRQILEMSGRRTFVLGVAE